MTEERFTTRVLNTIKPFWLEISFLTAVFIFSLWLATYLADIRQMAVVVSPSRESSAELVGGGYLPLFEAHSARPAKPRELAPIFTPSIQYWENDIIDWSIKYNLDPNLIATVMQIESCGLESAGSNMGAMGLFQVMPFHFAEGEDPYDPDTNALRGLNYLRAGFEIAEGNAGLAMAGYNGGHGVIWLDASAWPGETLRYYTWGTSIYRDASTGQAESPALQDWIEHGGGGLCIMAEESLDISS